ncbi:MAG: hypothetical protein CL961_03330 [Euryarchaeota archaeon]|nr:hypothetical protein [Euryarchaeota archaeon]
MPQKTNLNVAPYYDDFDSDKNFYKVLFRPGYSIQTRELTSLQSILQNQIESFGKFNFKQGQQVIPGEVGLNTKLDYVKLSSVSEVAVSEGGQIVYKKYDIKKLVGTQLQGLNSGVVCRVLDAEYGSDIEADTLFVKYTTSGSASNETTFRQGETLEVIAGINTPLLVVGTDGSVLPTSITREDPVSGIQETLSSPAMGFSTAVDVQEGVYFVNGFFVNNSKQLLVVDKYYNKASAKVGFTINEVIVTPEEDASLYDNARGFSNASAPGAHRLTIDLVLRKFDYSASTDKNFIQLVQIKAGVVEKQVKSADYTLLEETLARRTYDESGDYVVEDFDYDIREYYQREGNNGVFALNESTGLVNKTYTATQADGKMILSVSSGKAYVKGYEIVNKESKILEVNKGRDTLSRDNVTIKSKGLPEYSITNVYGSVPLNTVGDEITGYPTVTLNSVFNDGTIGFSNLEADDYFKGTVDRRSTPFQIKQGIKTVYIQTIQAQPTELSGIPDEFWFVTTRGTNTRSGAKATVIGKSIVRRPEVNPGSTAYFIEATLLGDKSALDNYLVEYDDGESDFRRYTYLSESDMKTGSNEHGFIVDYNETITPVVGVAKPKNFRLINRGIGFNSDSDIVLSKGRTGTSTPYNGTFGLSYFNPTFFTRLKLERNISTDTFLNGKYIYGKESKAYGVIENDSTGNFSGISTLFVTTLSGQFIPGETIIDEENNAIKIAKENTISHFIVNKRGSGYASSVSLKINGTIFDQSKIDVQLVGGEFAAVTVADRGAVQETYAAPPTIGLTEDKTDAAVITPVLFKNTVLTYNPQNIKSLASTYNNYTFTSDLDFSSTTYATYQQISEFTFFGYSGRKYLECNGFGADLSSDLIQGDVIQFTDANNNVLKNIVQYVTLPENTEKSRIYLDYALPLDVNNATIVRLRPRLSNTSATLVYPTGSKQVASLVSDSANTKFKYHVRKDFITDLSSSGGNLTFTAQLPVGTQKFVGFSENDFLITVLDKGSSTVVDNGDIVYIDPRFIEVEDSVISAGSVTAGALRIKNLPSNYFGDILDGNYPKLKLTATVEIDKARPRLKTAIRDKRLIIISSGDRVIPLRGQDYDSDVIETFSYSDVFKLKYIYEGTTTNPPSVDATGNLVSGTDVTYKFKFDDGQRDTYYDVSRIILKPGFDAPTGQLVVAFDFFEHSQGDFCTVDSYLHEAGVLPEEIPLFNSSVNGVISLRDSIDFRPKVDGNTTITGFQDQSIVELFDTTDYITFLGTGGIPTATPAPDVTLPYTVSFSEKQYLDRVDGLFLTKKGEFIIKEGNASLNPSKPEPVDDAVSLCYLHIPAFTNSSKDVRIMPVDNRRYTMRDIGKLEKRVERLEYYTTLSILEQQALNMQVKNEIGLDRFKSGFLVDNFESHRTGNLKSEDYLCAIDTQQSVLRPQSKEDSFRLEEINTREDQRIVSGYVVNDGVVTLPYESVEILGNKNATKTINPNPFVVIQYVGEGVISPQQDSWYDQTVAPLVVDANTKLNSVFVAKDNVADAYSAIYNSFIVNWVGADQQFLPIESLANITSEDIESSVQPATTQSSSNVSPQNNELGKGINSKSVNGKKISTSLQFFARSIPVKFVVNRLKPNTQVYLFMEGRDVNAWAVPDSRFSGVAGSSLSTFGAPLVTDSNGNLSGLFLVPAGLPPSGNTRWTGNVDTVTYDDAGETIRFTTGTKTIRFTADSTDADKAEVDTYAEVKFYAAGALPENPSSIISTSASFFKANEGVQLVDSNTDNPIRPNPLAQTFKIENFEGGLMATGVDLFFNKKSGSIPIRAYLTDVVSGKPGKNILPGTQVSMTPETYLRVYVTGENETVSVNLGEFVTGKNSNASGPIAKVFDSNLVRVGDDTSTTFQLNKEQVYTLVLDNHNGTDFLANESLTVPSVDLYNAKNNTTLGVFIAKDSGKVTDLKVRSVGEGYESASIVIESPQLPGGSTATGSISVSDGMVYNCEVSLNGRGYTEPPSVVVKGVGLGNNGAVVDSVLEIDTPAVRMGVAIDSEGVTQSTTPTRFNFKHPVYLQNNTEYALAIETDSIEYEIWASKLGEVEIATSNVVTTQPLLGSVYKSQNTDNWTEDLFEDVKFVLYRGEFDTSSEAELEVTNETLGYEPLRMSPFETSVRSATNATSSLFKGNNSIVKVYHRDNGFEDTGNSYVFFQNALDVGGVTGVTLNQRLFKVSNGGIDFYNILSPNGAGSSVIGGGTSVLATYNRKYERLYAQVPYLQLDGTKIDSFVSTTNVVPVDSDTKNYVSYSSEDYERTFLGEEHYFTNQKFIASRINETMNGLAHSLKYKFKLSSTNSALSPVIDLRTASVKTATNRVENSTGYEDRFGKRNQVLTFAPLYIITMSVTGSNAGAVLTNRTLVGQTSKAEGFITSVENGNEATIRLKTKTPFQKGESLDIYNEQGVKEPSVSLTITNIAVIPFNFSVGSNVIAYYPQDSDVDYNNKINGKVILWDPEDKVLIIENSYLPINSNYTSSVSDEEIYTRKSTSAEQLPDIFRTGDIVESTGDTTPVFVEVSSISYTTGVDYVPETDAVNSSSVAKYVTKEVFINNPGSSIDVRATVNATDIENIKIYYKIRESSSSANFDDINWVPFNVDGNPNNDDLATPNNSISGQFEKQEDYQELIYSAENLAEFTSFSVKIIMKTDNPSYVPKIQDLRAVASY